MKKILVVDDSVIILKALSMKLRASGYSVVTAEDGGTAINMARREKPDLILLDLNFPPDVAHDGGVPWDGFSIMAWLKRLEEARNTPIIIITSGAAEEYKSRALAEGAIAFFHKPIDNDELLATIRETIGGAPVENVSA